VFEKSVGFATILLLFLFSQILPFMCFATLLVVVVVVPNSSLRVLLHLLLFLFIPNSPLCVFATFVVFVFVVANFLASCFATFFCCCCYSKFTTSCFATFVVANFLTWCFATFVVVVVPNSPLCVLLHLLFIVLVAPNSLLRDLPTFVVASFASSSSSSRLFSSSAALRSLATRNCAQ
jgi:hypothetical protein